MRILESGAWREVVFQEYSGVINEQLYKSSSKKIEGQYFDFELYRASLICCFSRTLGVIEIGYAIDRGIATVDRNPDTTRSWLRDHTSITLCIYNSLLSTTNLLLAQGGFTLSSISLLISLNRCPRFATII